MIDSDDEYTLFSVVIFKRAHDDFLLKCRENKYGLTYLLLFYQPGWNFTRFIIRDFVYSDDSQLQQREEFDAAGMTEKELWVE